jgi:proteasome accessory factor C
MSRVTADDRVRRMLSMVPVIAARPDGVPIDELCERFDIDRSTLINDLTTLSYVGVAPYTPDTQVECELSDDRVWVRYPQWFDRPLRLTPEQALALVVAGRGLATLPGADPDGALARGLAKVAASLALDADDALDVHLGDSSSSHLELLRTAVAEHRRVHLTYYAYGRDERTERDIDPYRLYADQGQWYVFGHCHLAGGTRVFRVDRIADAALLPATFEPPDDEPTLAVFQPAPGDPRVRLVLAPGARWVLEHYPCEEHVELDDGRVEVTLVVSALPWLERLLLRLGPDAELVDPTPEVAGLARAAAARVLTRYR